ncbi:hypothetical protein KPH14_009278 [Odynerus spinipes]|uniref:Uncharacterized protein n=1 Tax=Odynerus spinipes TaxID=1348599 RepID=A0AAD9RQ40_9HYME|nr:hypothetical protein KPH14_009278 [Odynerus spinipes]
MGTMKKGKDAKRRLEFLLSSKLVEAVHQRTEEKIKKKMHTRIIPLFLISCVLLCSTVGKTRMINSDLFYFPDQAEYIKRAFKCLDGLILWPGNGRCYKEGERGPCNIGRVLVLDKQLLPQCKDVV